MNPIGLCLDPLDVLFFRDGRSFDAASKVVSGLPTPQVLAGAVRTALLEKYGCNFAELGRSTKSGKSFADGLPGALRWIAGVRFRGPWLCSLPATDGATVADVFLPAPATVHTGKKGGAGVSVLKPLKEGALPGWNEPLRPLWLNGTAATESASNKFIDSFGLDAFLNERPVSSANLRKGEGDPDKPEPYLYSFDTRTGIGIDGAKLAAADGEIYGIRFLALRGGVGFYAEIDLPDSKGPEVFDGVRFLAFGGEGKRVAIHTVPKFAFPEPPPCGSNQKRFVLLTTPAVANTDGKPYLPQNCVAAAVNSPVAISGWDIAKGGPKPTKFASPAGSVYFLHSTATANEPDDEFGYGRHLQGVWTDE